jgi:hypothetical protein
MREVFGMNIDPQRRELWANTCHPGADERPPPPDPEPEHVGRTAVMRYDLRSGERDPAPALGRRIDGRREPARCRLREPAALIDDRRERTCVASSHRGAVVTIREPCAPPAS